LGISNRIVFIARAKKNKNTARQDFILFQKRTLYLALSTSYLFVLTALWPVSEYIQISIFLLALYGSYFYYPSIKRLTFEVRIFRVSKE